MNVWGAGAADLNGMHCQWRPPASTLRDPPNTNPVSDGLSVPRRVEFLTHDISVHVPHHVNSKIPWYNLRAANESLKSNWGEVRSPLLKRPLPRHSSCLRGPFRV